MVSQTPEHSRTLRCVFGECVCVSSWQVQLLCHPRWPFISARCGWDISTPCLFPSLSLLLFPIIEVITSHLPILSRAPSSSSSPFFSTCSSLSAFLHHLFLATLLSFHNTPFTVKKLSSFLWKWSLFPLKADRVVLMVIWQRVIAGNGVWSS